MKYQLTHQDKSSSEKNENGAITQTGCRDRLDGGEESQRPRKQRAKRLAEYKKRPRHFPSKLARQPLFKLKRRQS
jgi:hypothetical protein